MILATKQPEAQKPVLPCVLIPKTLDKMLIYMPRVFVHASTMHNAETGRYLESEIWQ
jgi:hypothetical protein